MKKNYLKKLLTVGKAVVLCSALLHFGSAKAQLTDLNWSATGGITENKAINQVVFGAINAADNGKDQDMLICGYTVTSHSTGAYAGAPFIKIYRNTGIAPYYDEANPANVTLPISWTNTNWATLRQYTGNYASWSKKDGRIVVTGIDGTTKTTKVFERNGSGGYVEIVSPLSGGGTLAGSFGFSGFGDFDGDGDEDIFLYDTGKGTSPISMGVARVYNRNADGTYTEMAGAITEDYAAQFISAIAISDYNFDGKDDIAITGFATTTSTGNKTALYKSTSAAPDTHSFAETVPVGLPQLGASALAFIDTDGDGKATDLLLAGNTGATGSNTRRLALFKNSVATPDVYTAEFNYGDGATADTQLGTQYSWFGVGDLRGEGKMQDFITVGQRNSNINRPIVGVKDVSGATYTLYNSMAASNNAAISTYNSNTAPNSTFFGNVTNIVGGTTAVLRGYAFGDIDADGKKDDLVQFAAEYHGANAGARQATTGFTNDVTVLPVTGIEFAVKAESNGAKLTWSTQSEKDNKAFLVSRSTDGATFTTLTSINGAGTSSTVNKYEFTDKAPASGINYYKLSQVDVNGTTTDLGVKSLRFGLVASAANAYPNPTKGFTTVAVNAGAYNSYTVVGLQGNTIATGTVGNTATSVDIDLTSVAKGTYIIKLSGASGKSSTKVVKL